MARNTVQRVTLYKGNSFEPYAQTENFQLDYAYGDTENSFELIIEQADIVDVTMSAFRLEDSTDIAGFVDGVESVYKNGYYTITFHGTSMQGVFDKRIVQPYSGQDYYTVKGTLSDCLTRVLADTGLTGSVLLDSIPPVNIDYQFERYCTLWQGLRKLAKQNQMIIRLTFDDNARILLSFIPSDDMTINSANISYDATKYSKFITHAIALGAGELRNRAVGHAYWDGKQVTTTRPSGFVESYMMTFEASSTEQDKIAQYAADKLTDELKNRQTLQVKEPDGEYPLDSSFSITDMPTGMSVSASINKLIIKISRGVKTLSMEVG
ncbi:hypothetical protein [Alloscardovia omnicolens]|uniref:hypothetical protein n=1 Tax=Alloscardovia omnicolens TaxID=419015 RepID=UPI0028E47C29|nr:hypothetical protein [Alloscardovia omnicolens]